MMSQTMKITPLLLSFLALCSIDLPSHAQDAPRATVSAALNMSALQPGQQGAVAVVLDVKPGFHAQSHAPKGENFIPTEVLVNDTATISAFAPIYPAGKDESYPALGNLNVYSGKTIIYVPVQVSSTASPGPSRIAGTITYQICDDSVCYAPETTPFDVQTKLVAAGESVQANQTNLFAGFDPSVFSRLVKATPQAQHVMIFGRDLDQAPLFFIFFAAFVIGIIFNVVPCVLPVVPLKIMSFYQAAQHSRVRSVLLSIVFGLGITTVFAALGLMVVVLRLFDWGKLFTSGYFLAAIVLLLILFAFWQFGIMNFILPQAVYRHVPQGETYIGNYLFGIFTAILSTPCTFGLFLGLLVWASTQPGVIGLSLLISVGVGMAFPYVLLSGFPELARRFPRTGPWAELVKQMMGFLLLASAVYFARRFIEEALNDKVFWWSLFAVVLAAGIFLVIRTAKFSKSWIGPAVACVIAILFVAPSLMITWRLTNPPIDWKPYTEQSLASARRAGKPVMVEFTAAWCGNCLALETTVFHDQRTVEAIKQQGVITLRADVTRNDAPGWILLRSISPVGAIPLTAVYAPNAARPTQLSGIYSTDELVRALRDAARAESRSASAGQ